MKTIHLILIALFFFSFNFQVRAQEKKSADEVIEILKSGNQRFVNQEQMFPNLDEKVRKKNATDGQHPYATIIGCSDSRVPIEYIFDAGIGEIFVIRVAGNVVNIDEAGSIEYGVDHLHTPVLVVLGHTNCGAVTAVARGDHVHGNIPGLVENIKPAVEKAKSTCGHEFSHHLLNKSIENNVFQSIEDLFSISSTSLDLVKAGKLKVVGAIYDIETGSVEWLGEHPQQENMLQ